MLAILPGRRSGKGAAGGAVAAALSFVAAALGSRRSEPAGSGQIAGAAAAPISKPGEHIIISGTGRTGTTFLVQYFTALGFDTGYSLDEARSAIDPISFAGLERALSRPELPYVIKSPHFADQLGRALVARRLRIRAAIIPVRNLHHAAESRRRVHREAAAAGRDPMRTPGTLWSNPVPEQQEALLAEKFHKLIHTLTVHAIPMYFLPYPQFVLRHPGLYRSLKPLLDEHGVAESASAMAHRLVARPDLVHRFGADGKGTGPHSNQRP
jgi:hypothetical protein